MFGKLVIFMVLTLTINMQSLFALDKSIAGISFSPPQEWKETQPSSSMRAFQFEIPGKAKSAELAVFYFGKGQGGDIKGNIERWKGQFTKLEKEETREKNVNGLKLTQTSFEGSYQITGGPMMEAQGDPVTDYALLGAIVEAPEGSVFFKMIGPKDTVSGAKPAFEALVDSLKKS